MISQRPRVPNELLAESMVSTNYLTAFSTRHAGEDPAVQEVNEVKTFAICSPGDIGKTQSAIEFVFTHRGQYNAIFWMFAYA